MNENKNMGQALITIIATNLILGFFFWVFWQIMAISSLVPNISLLTGIAMWFFWFMLWIPYYYFQLALKGIDNYIKK